MPDAAELQPAVLALLNLLKIMIIVIGYLTDEYANLPYGVTAKLQNKINNEDNSLLCYSIR